MSLAAAEPLDVTPRSGQVDQHDPEPTVRRSRLRRAWTVLAVSALFIALAAWRVGLALQAAGPTIFGDELLYFRNAESLAHLTWYHNAHYPPVYATVLAPAFWTGVEIPWRAALVISAVVGATVVPAAYWLARTAGARHPIAAAVLAAVLPGTSAFSQNLMSENIGVPLTLVGVTLALRGRRTPPLLMGVAVTLLGLTKYLYLPLALVLVVTWWWMRSRGAPVQAGEDRPVQRPLRALALLALPVVTAVGAWLAYATASGATMTQATGAAIVRRTSSTLDVGSAIDPITLWLSLYLSYLAVACVPMVLVACWLVLSRGAGGRLVSALRARVVSRRAALLLTAAVLTAGFVVVAVRHSLGAPYNSPDPDHYQARYLMHLVALLAVTAVVGLDMVLDRRDALRGWRPWVGALAACTFVYVAFSALFGELFSRYESLTGMTFPALSPDVHALGEPWAFVGLIGLIVLSAALVAFRRRLPVVLVWIIAAALATAASFPPFVAGRGATAHKIADLVHSQDQDPEAMVVCVGAELKPPTSGASAFWELPAERVVALSPGVPVTDLTAIVDSCRTTAGAGPDDLVLYVTTEPGDLEPTSVDSRWGSTMAIFAD